MTTTSIKVAETANPTEAQASITALSWVESISIRAPK
jgi:hypothetical protein